MRSLVRRFFAPRCIDCGRLLGESVVRCEGRETAQMPTPKAEPEWMVQMRERRSNLGA